MPPVSKTALIQLMSTPGRNVALTQILFRRADSAGTNAPVPHPHTGSATVSARRGFRLRAADRVEKWSVTVDALWRRSVIALWRSFPTSFTSMPEMAREDRDIKREQL